MIAEHVLVWTVCVLVGGCGSQDLNSGAASTPEGTRERQPKAGQTPRDLDPDGQESEVEQQALRGTEVSDSPEEIATVRKQYAEELNGLYSRALEEVRKGDLVSSECEWVLKQRKPQSVALLSGIVKGAKESAAGRAQAARMLLQLENPEGKRFLVDSLKSPSGPLRTAALRMLGEYDAKTDLNAPDRAGIILALIDDSDADVVRQGTMRWRRVRNTSAG